MGRMCNGRNKIQGEPRMSDDVRRELEEIKNTLNEIRRSLPMIAPYYPVTYNTNDTYVGPCHGYNPDFGKK